MLLDEGMPDRPRRGERAGVVPITPDRAAPTDGVVDRACEPDSEPRMPRDRRAPSSASMIRWM